MGDPVNTRPARDRRSSRWDEHREARRTALVAATVQAVEDHGPEVSVERIAATAGVTKPVLYRYFTDKDALLAAAARWGAERVLAAVTQVLDADLAPREVVEQVVEAYLGEVEQHRNLFLVVVRQRADGDALADSRTAMAAALSRALGDLLREAGADAGGAEPWAQALVGLGLSTAEWWLERQTMSREALAAYLTQFVWHAFDGISREHAEGRGTPLALVRPDRGAS